MKTLSDNMIYKLTKPALVSLVRERENKLNESNEEIDKLTAESTEWEARYYKLENNWNELKEWLEEEFKANENWYNNVLTTQDRGFYKDEYETIKRDIKRVQRKMQEIESGK